MLKVIPASLNLGIALVFASVLIGCSPSGKRQGLYIGDRKIAAPPGEDPHIAGTLSLVKLEILGAGQFTLLDMGIPKEGSYRESGSKVLLRVESVLNREISSNPEIASVHAKEIEVEFESDSIEFFDPNAPENGRVLLKKQVQPD